MVTPIYQQGEELLLNQFGSKYLGVAAHTNVNSNEFIVQEDAVISVLTGGDSSIAANNVDYKASMSLSGVTLKQGALIVAPQGESFQSMTIDSGTIMTYDSVVSGTKPVAVPLLLDSYPDAAAAYSLRKLRTDYTGPAIKVRRTVGTPSNTDIGFVDDELDTASLLSFANGGDVFVAKWYDQSGNVNDVAQVSASAQPKIVSSGVVVTTSGNYAIDFSGATKTLVNATFNNSTQVSSVFTIVKSTSLAPQVITDGVDLASRQVSGYYAGSPSVFAINKGVTIKSAVPINTNINLLSTFFDVNSDLYLNGVQILNSVDAGSNTREGFTLGSALGSAASFEGSIFEVIVFDQQNKSSDRVGIETNINTHYTIY